MYGKNQHHIVIILQLKINKLRENNIFKKWKMLALFPSGMVTGAGVTSLELG